MISTSVRRFSQVRKELDDLGYSETLGVESVPLVDRLLHDLNQQRNFLKTAQSELEILKEKSKFSDTFDSHAKIKKAVGNNIQDREKHDKVIEEYKKNLQQLEHENRHLNFLNMQYKSKIQALEKESSETAKLLQQFQENGPKPAIQVTGRPKVDNGIFRKDRLEITELCPQKTFSGSIGGKIQRQLRDPFVVDLLELAETRITQLQETVAELNAKLETGTYMNNDCRNTLFSTNSEASDARKEEALGQLSTKTETLQQQIRQMEDSGAKEKQQNALRSVGRGNVVHSQSGSPPRKSILRSGAQSTTTRAKQIRQNNNERKSLDALENKELNDLRKDNEDLVALLANKDAELRRFEELASKLKIENEKLSEQIKQHNSDKYKNHNLPEFESSQHDTSHTDIPSATERLIHSLEAQRDQYRDEVKMLRDLLLSFQQSHYVSRNENSSFTRPRTSTSEETSATENPASTVHYTSMTTLKLLEEEKEFYKHQYEELLKEHLRKTHPRSPNKSPPTRDKPTPEYEEKLKLKYEVENLRSHLNEAKKDIATLKDDLNMALQSINQQQDSEAIGPSVQERSTSPILIDNQISKSGTEIRKLLGKVQSLQEIIKELEGENADLKSNLESHATLIKALESQKKTLQSQMRATHDELTNQTSHTQIRMIMENKDQANNNEAHAQDFNESETRVKQLELQIGELNRVIAKYQKEVVGLKSAIAALDREKNQLQTTSESKDEQVMEMQHFMNARNHDFQQTRVTISTLENELGKVQAELRNKEHELKNLNTQLSIKIKELERTNEFKESLQHEIHTLEENMGVLTKDNQNLSRQLEGSLREQEKLKQQIQEYVTEVTRVEELLKFKEQERVQLMEHFQNVAQENTVLDTQAHELEYRNSNVQLEVLAKESELKYCHDTIATLKHHIAEYELMQKNYEQQVSSLNSAMATLKSSFHQSQKEVEKLQEELTTSRDKCFQLELMQGNLQQQLSNREMERSKLLEQLEEMQEEVASLRTSLASEKATVLTLEGLLAANREREFCTQVTLQEMSAELRVLKERLQESEEKIRMYSKEIASCKTKVGELQMQIDRLKRQLTDERFEKERANQELRKLQQRSKTNTHILNQVSMHSTLFDNGDGHQSRSLTTSPLYSSTTQTSRSDTVSSTLSHKSAAYSNFLRALSPEQAISKSASEGTQHSQAASRTEPKRLDTFNQECEELISSDNLSQVTRDSPAGGGKSSGTSRSEEENNTDGEKSKGSDNK